ncbi:UDP-N-acetylmuramoyl-tripeptide--D-alanyl-D-alanine ligase [Formosa sp. S-31]|uniref:UDP-N-acetylmuramoyl-tripeptide--D-alanyl-D- alanine ligase n=1 Tax=Formosa sp. S-31 TaxID=2790949 RepID=UPI003EBB3850
MKIQDLHHLFLACNAVCTDTRTLQKNDIFFALSGENFNGNTFAEKAIESGAKYAVIDQAEYKTSEKTILVENVLETLQALASFNRTYLNIPIIALTGSNGKTTTKELINAVLSTTYKTTATTGNLNNHIGVPLTLLSMTKNTEIGIVEMGANHLKEIDFLCQIAQPNYGYITNFGKAHLEGFGSLEGVVLGKTELYRYLGQHNGMAFINVNDSKQVEQAKGLDQYTFGKEDTEANAKIDLKSADPLVVCTYNDLTIKSNLIGIYNFNNISAAIAIGQYFKVKPKGIQKAIELYNPKNNRSQIIQKENQQIILDAYNANPTSMKAALESFSSLKATSKIAIIGDMFELGKEADKEHQDISNLAIALNIDQIITIGHHFAKSTINSEKLINFNTFEDFSSAIHNLHLKEATLLIKASRGMKLERILDLL